MNKRGSEYDPNVFFLPIKTAAQPALQSHAFPHFKEGGGVASCYRQINLGDLTTNVNRDGSE